MSNLAALAVRGENGTPFECTPMLVLKRDPIPRGISDPHTRSSRPPKLLTKKEDLPALVVAPFPEASPLLGL